MRKVFGSKIGASLGCDHQISNIQYHNLEIRISKFTMNPLPIAIILPHAGLDIPPEMEDRLALSERDIFNEADIYTDLIFDYRDRVSHWLRFPYARVLIDTNRADHPDRIPRRGDGIIKTQTSYGAWVFAKGREPDKKLEHALIDRYWRPWNQQMAAIAADPSIELVIYPHSMSARRPSMYGNPDYVRPRCCICNLGDADGEIVPQRGKVSIAPAITRGFAAELGSLVDDIPALGPVDGIAAINQPFWGGWQLWEHSNKAQPWVMIELSRALYLGEQSADSPIRPPNWTAIQTLRERMWEGIVDLYHHVKRDVA